MPPRKKISQKASLRRVTKDIHERRAKPRKMIEWYMRLRSKISIVWATGILVMGVYMAADPERRKAIRGIWKNIDSVVTTLTQAGRGATRIVADAGGIAGHVTGKVLTVVHGASVVDSVRKSVDEVARLAKESEPFVKKIIETVIPENNIVHFTSLNTVLRQYSSYITRKPGLPTERFNTRIQSDTKHNLLTRWIPHIANIVHTRNLQIKHGLRKNSHDASNKNLLRKFHKSLNMIV